MAKASASSRTVSYPKLTKTSMFSRMNYQVDRGMKELLVPPLLIAEEWHSILEFFDYRCAFCGTGHTGNKRTGIIPDHLIPASEYGALCIGNVVPACHSCNDRRGDKPWDQYLKESLRDRRKQAVPRIRSYIRKYPYKAIKSPHEALSTSQYREFRRIMASWSRLWRDAQALRKAIGRRRREI